MTTFLFWNLNGKTLVETVCNLAISYEVDVLILAEMKFAPGLLLEALNKTKTIYRYATNIGCEMIHIFTRFRNSFMKPIHETERLTIRRLKIPNSIEILLAVAHLPSKLYLSESGQIAYSSEVANEIQKAEQKAGHRKTVLVGDLNMTPFDKGTVIATGLHSVMSRNIARKVSRRVSGYEYPFFYNPMWNLLGDRDGNIPGTYYYSSEDHVGYFWHIFDQVLIRPELIDNFDLLGLKILTSDGDTSFLSENGLPTILSDHLPIKFTLEL